MSVRRPELAPFAMARVAGWPVTAVAGLGSPALSAQARSHPNADAPSRELLEKYDEAIERERRALWARTAGDPRFSCALSLVNPALGESLLDRDAPMHRTKRVRHLETTLYRYLARAVARTEPCGAWCGVTTARLAEGAESRLEAAARVFHVTPDLSPFRTLVVALADREVYRSRSLYKLNPTLAKSEPDAYVFWAPTSEDGPVRRRLRANVVTSSMMSTLAGRETWQLPAAAAALCEASGLALSGCERAVESFRAAGVLVGGLAFPKAFDGPWEALELASLRLRDDHRAAWDEARAGLRLVARAAEAALDDDDASALIASMDAAMRITASLYAACGVEPYDLPRACLRCDMRAPWIIDLGRTERAAIDDSLSAYVRFQATTGLASVLERAAHRWWLGADPRIDLDSFVPPTLSVDGARPLTWESLHAALGSPAELGLRIDAARRQLDHPDAPLSADGEGVTHELRHPLESARFSFTRGRDGLLVHALGVDVTGAFSRIAPTLDCTHAHALISWFRDAHLMLHERFGVELLVLSHDHDVPNVLARPALWSGTLDFWGTEIVPALRGRSMGARGLHLSTDVDSGVWLVREAHSTRAFSVVAATAAVVDPHDGCLHALLASSGRLPPDLTMRGTPVFEVELEKPRYGARLALAEGTVLRQRRTLLSGASLQPLLASKGVARFVIWQRMAAHFGWPELVMAQRDLGPPLLVARDSAIAIEALFEGARETQCLRVEEPPNEDWVRGDDDDAESYYGELVLPLMWAQHRWSARRSLVAASQHHVAAE